MSINLTPPTRITLQSKGTTVSRNINTLNLDASFGVSNPSVGVGYVDQVGTVGSFNGHYLININDFVYGSTGAASGDLYGFQLTSAGGQASYFQGTDGTYLGRALLDTKNSTAANPTIDSFAGTNLVQVGSWPWSSEWRVRVETLSTATDRFVIRVGTSDTTAATPGRPTNGIQFEYTDNVNGGQWTAVTTSASTSTVVNSTVPVVANTWYRLRADVNAAGTQITFIIDDVILGTASTNISLSPTRLKGHIQKTAGNNSRTLSIDYVGWISVR